MDLNIGNNVSKQQSNNVNQQIRQSKSLLTNPIVTTIVAKAVSVSKFENNEIIPVGKYGFALAGDVKFNYYQLLLYGSKSSVLVNIILTKDFKYDINENNTVGFLSKENWYLEFVSTNDAVDFNSHLAFVLWKLNGSRKLFWMDLYYPSRNNHIATLDSIVEITYIANTIQGKTLGPEVSNNIKDSRFLKVNVSEEGWESSLLGVNENTQRIVFIPAAEMGAWKILTDVRQCLCLKISIQKVYEIKENNVVTDLPVMSSSESFDNILQNNYTPIQPKEIISSDLNVEIVAPLKTLSLELLYEEFEKLKLDNIKTNNRLAELEAIVKEKKTQKIENDYEFKKSMKTVYKCIIREFPVDQTFSGDKIQTTIKSIFHNILMISNQPQTNND